MVDEQHQEPTVFSNSSEIRDLAGYVFMCDLALIVLSSAVDVAVCAAPRPPIRTSRPKRVGQEFHELGSPVSSCGGESTAGKGLLASRGRQASRRVKNSM